MNLYEWIVSNTVGPHPSQSEIPSLTTYARELGIYTALYVPFTIITDADLLAHLTQHNILRPPYFRNSNNLITKTPITPEDFLTQNRQHRAFLDNLAPDSNQTFIVDNDTLIETKPMEPEDLLTKTGIIARNQLTRTVTYSAHATAVPDITLPNTRPTIGIPSALFAKLKLSVDTPIMFLRNPVIKTDGVHFAYPIPTDNTHVISVHPYFCDGMNLDFDGDMVQIYRIMHPENITKAIQLITTRYPSPLPAPTNKDFALLGKIDSLSLQDYVQNTQHFQKFIDCKPSKKVNHSLHLDAVDLCKTRTEQQFAEHLTRSSAYSGLFKAKSDIGKTGGLYKKLVYAFPDRIPEIMALIEPLSQATLDQKHTQAGFSVDRIVNAFNELNHPSNLQYILENTKPEHHAFVNYLHTALSHTPLAIRHRNNMPLLTYLGTKFTPTFPNNFHSRKPDNLFSFIQSLNSPTRVATPVSRPNLPEISSERAQSLSASYIASLLCKSEMIPQKYLRDGAIFEHRFNKTLVDKTNAFSQYLTSQMVSVPYNEKTPYILPPIGFCPYQRTEKDPEDKTPITFVPNFPGHLTSATPMNIPYLHNTEHARLVYACNNIKQALQLAHAEEPLCRTKYHRTLKIGVNLLCTFSAHPDVYEDAVVISRTASQKLATVDGRPAQVGDKLTGRHGNKSVISRILADEDMNGAEVIFSPMSVTSRKNFGFLAEIQSNIYHSNQPHIETPIETLLSQPDPKINGILTGMCYILRNSHTAEAGMKYVTIPHSYTQFGQPAQGENISLNHLYALETLDMRSLIAEFFSFRSNREQIEARTQNLYQEPQSIQLIRTLYNKLVC